ncbi:hypothetical protein [uncultured Jatrophihabitans sp.]|uniref:hypothetical protein n=1 Tax=uncultured Jatrophihabitans sp. TaxID=1610747 RepID=UPI0035CB590A
MPKKKNRGPTLPPRGPALSDRSFLLCFDIDCGELVPGHHFVARGLSDVGQLNRSDWDESATDSAPVQGFALEYELTPGVSEGHRDDFFRYLVGVSYDADVELPWEPTDGGAIAPFVGGPSTHGSRGDWPLPADARLLTFTLFGVEAGSTFTSHTPAGELVVDLETRSARWLPA